jgi:hypothetical protein
LDLSRLKVPHIKNLSLGKFNIYLEKNKLEKLKLPGEMKLL